MEVSKLTERLLEVAAPLEPEEEARAIERALAHLGDGPYEVRGAELRLDKPRRRTGAPDRRIAVVAVEKDTNVVHEVLVDPRRNRVAEETVLEGRILPFTEAEVERAVAIAEADRTVARAARRKGAVRATFYPSHHAGGERHRAQTSVERRVGLHYFTARRPDQVRPVVSVVVDLASETVASVTDRAAAPSQRSG